MHDFDFKLIKTGNANTLTLEIDWSLIMFNGQLACEMFCVVKANNDLSHQAIGKLMDHDMFSPQR